MNRRASAAEPGGHNDRQQFPLGSTLLLISVFFMTFLARTILSPLLLPIERDLGVTHAEAGSFFLIISIGLIATMLGSGFVSQRLNHHRMIALSVGVSGAGALLLGASTTIAAFRAALVLLGAGAGLYLPSGLTTLTDVVPSRQWGRALALHELGPILGLFAGPVLAEIALGVGGWRSVLIAIGAISLVMAVVFSRWGAGGRFHGAPPHWSALREVVATRRFWIITFFFVMAVGLELGVYAMLPTYLVVDRGLDQSLVNTIVSTSRLTSLLAVFAAGWLSDRFGVRHVIGGVAVTAGLVTAVLGFAGGWLLITAVYLQPMLISSFFPAGLTALAGVGRVERRNLAVSVVVPVAYLFGAGMIPAILGHLAEVNLFGTGFIGVGVLMIVGAFLVGGLRERPREG